jgi:outer membrane protein OmpA-like peptidoglycan-associated protein
MTNDPATNGCKDSDSDGIVDKVDACPTERGAPNSDPQLNGCPDTDGDGVVDKKDACPREVGPPNEDPSKNGCPDKDRDKDGITNDVDACPDEPGQPDPDPKKNGCPRAFISQGQIKIIDQVKFKTGSAAIEQGRDSLDILEAVAKVLRDHPEVKHVRVEGHTDKTGSAALNKKLSADRAASVVKWLTANGIDKARLSSQGFGSEKPIDTNETDAGRKNNRRVEFHIE